MKPWEAGDPVGSGEIYLPDAATKRAYGDACRKKLVESYARHVLDGKNIAIRRARVSRCPKEVREMVKSMVQKMWDERQGQHDLFRTG